MPVTTPARTPDLRQTNLSRRLPSSVTGAAPPVLEQSAPVAPAQVPGLITDPNALPAQITPENTLRGQRLGFGVEAQQVADPAAVADIQSRDTEGAIQAAFQAAMPQLNQQFADESEALAKRTSALGRTGSGQFNKETGFISDRARGAREALLGNLAFTAIQGDANRALQASQANLQSGLGQQNLAAQIAQANAAARQNVGFAQQGFLQQQQQREDALAREAVQDQATRMGFLGQGFGGDPTGAVGLAAQTGLQGSENFGANAATLNQQTQGTTQSIIEAILNSGLIPGTQPAQPVAG